MAIKTTLPALILDTLPIGLSLGSLCAACGVPLWSCLSVLFGVWVTGIVIVSRRRSLISRV